MADATALLLSAVPSLIDTVRGVIRSIDSLALTVCADSAEACARLERDGPAVLLVHPPPGWTVNEVARLLRAAVAARPPVATVVLGDQAHNEQAQALLRLGVVDYLGRPLDLGRLASLLDLLTVRARYTLPVLSAAAEPAPVRVLSPHEPFLYTPAAAMGRVMDHVQRVAPQDTTLLLHGPTGTGKTRLARLIHELSPRRAAPFLVVDCGALAANLIESEMFGHVRGAFTGADRDRDGKFTEAGGGTLLLDEVDALPWPSQTKLLRAVDERVFEPVGSNKSLPLRARLIAATNQALDQEVAAGRFRPDLYYRLNVVSFSLPPLCERPHEIRPLAQRCLAEFAARNGRKVHGITAEALRALEEHDWPGNIRELRNVIERAVALCPGPEIQLDDLPEEFRPHRPAARPGTARAHPAAVSSLAQTKRQAEVLHITEVLQKHRNNRRRAAVELGISRGALYKKLHKYGLMGAAEDLAP